MAIIPVNAVNAAFRVAIADRNVEEADRLAKAHATQIARQVRKLLTRAGDTGIAL